MGESLRSKKSTDRRGIRHLFLCRGFSFAHSLFELFDQVLPVRVCVGGRAGSISETALSLSVSAGVFSAGDVEFSVCTGVW